MTTKLEVGGGGSSPFVFDAPTASTQQSTTAPPAKKKSLIQVVDGSDSDSDSPPPIEEEEDLTSIVKPPPPPSPSSSVEKTPESEGPSLMEIMMADAEAAKKVKQEVERRKKAKEAKKSMGGLKGGFFNSKKKKKKKKASGDEPPSLAAKDTKATKKKVVEEEDVYELDANGEMVKSKSPIIPTIKKNDSKTDSKVFAEVQDAMKRNPLEGMKQEKWANESLMQTIAKNPRLALGLSNPRFSAAIQELQTNPKLAMEKYKNDKPVFDFLNEFCGVMGEHFAKLGEEQEKDEEKKKAEKKATKSVEDDLIGPLAAAALEKDEERRKAGGVGWDEQPTSKEEQAKVDKIIQDQELSTLLMDPAFQRVIQECGIPGKMQMYMNDPKVGPKLRKLIDSGLLKVER